METKDWVGCKAAWKEWSKHIAVFYVVDIERKCLGDLDINGKMEIK